MLIARTPLTAIAPELLANFDFVKLAEVLFDASSLA